MPGKKKTPKVIQPAHKKPTAPSVPKNTPPVMKKSPVSNKPTTSYSKKGKK